MTISKEERAEIRSVISDAQHKGKDIITLPLDCIIPMLDALEAARDRAEAIENRADEVISDLIDSHRNMEFRAEAAGAETTERVAYWQKLSASMARDADEEIAKLKARAEAAERERDMLAEALALCTVEACDVCKGVECPWNTKLYDVKPVAEDLIEWARQQARGGEI